MFANCCSIPLGWCNCTAPCAFWLQLKNQCEDCIHPSKGPVMCESQWARPRPACDYLLFQLFPRLTLWVGEKVVCVCMCVLVWRWGVGALKCDGENLSSRREYSEKRELQKQCVCPCVYNLSESVSCSYYSVVCLPSGNTPRQPRHLIQYMLFPLAYTHRGGWSPVCACPHTNTPICLAAPHIDWSASQTQSHKGWPRFQHMHTQAGCKENYNARIHMWK